MPRSLLLIIDGESLKTPELIQVLNRDGWEVLWLDSTDLSSLSGIHEAPDLALFDTDTLGRHGLSALTYLRAMKATLPLVALGNSGQAAELLKAGGLDPTTLHVMAPDTPVDSWPARLRSCLGGYGPGAHKFTAEDLFGDILADLEGPPPAPRIQASAPRPQAPPPQAVPPRPAPAMVFPETVPDPGALAALPDLFAEFMAAPPAPAPIPVPAPIPAPAPVPAPAPIPVPAAIPLPAPVAEPVPDPVPAPVPAQAATPAPAPEDAYTLAGVPGGSDPFGLDLPDWGAPAPAPVGEPELLDAAGDAEEFGNYYLLEKVAVGGMAELFKARQRGVHDFEKIVAIKRILPHLSDNDEFVRMFIDEAKLAAQLTHPNIVQIFDLGRAAGFYYIAMEFVDGRDLRALLRKVREYNLPLPEAIAAAVTMKVANALDYAHRKRGINDRDLKLVHRDISPQNILISSEGEVKLVDFGIAKAATKSTQTMAGALKGKLLYMSPEQALGENLDSRSDIYSLGLVLFELLTGERCFQADNELGVLEKVRLGKVQQVRAVNPAVSAEMAAILARVLQKDVDQRYASARLLERDLKALLVKHGNEPTEHEVAEVVNTLLKGTQDEVEALLAAKYPSHAVMVPPTVPALPREPMEITEDLPQLPPSPAPRPSSATDQAGPGASPRWLTPVLVAVLVGLLLVAWRLLR